MRIFHTKKKQQKFHWKRRSLTEFDIMIGHTHPYHNPKGKFFWWSYQKRCWQKRDLFSCFVSPLKTPFIHNVNISMLYTHILIEWITTEIWFFFYMTNQKFSDRRSTNNLIHRIMGNNKNKSVNKIEKRFYCFFLCLASVTHLRVFHMIHFHGQKSITRSLINYSIL